MKRSALKLPGIISDIDGVIHRGSNLIQGSDTAIKCLLNSHSNAKGEKFRLPFILLTNGGGWTEENHIKRLNEIVFGEKQANSGGFDPFAEGV